MKTLNDLPVGTSARVCDFQGEENVLCRLVELGLRPGLSVKIVRRVPLSGLLDVEFLYSRLALRPEQAACLLVEEETSPLNVAVKKRKKK